MKEIMVIMSSVKTKKQEQLAYLDDDQELTLVTRLHTVRFHQVHLRMPKAMKAGPIVKNKPPGRL
jgi:hypothetical protein